MWKNGEDVEAYIRVRKIYWEDERLLRHGDLSMSGLSSFSLNEFLETRV